MEITFDGEYKITAYDDGTTIRELYSEPKVLPAEPSPTEWLIDVGPYFDRFGPVLKLTILKSQDPDIVAIVKDVQVRKWVNLKLPEVAAGIDIIRNVIPQVTAELKDKVLHSPVLEMENLVLRKLYFS